MIRLGLFLSMAALILAVPSAALAGTATTGDATPGQPKESTEVLRGTVNFGACAGQVRFEWEKEVNFTPSQPQYTNHTDFKTVPAGAGDYAFSEQITGLDSDTAYHWRVHGLQDCNAQGGGYSLVNSADTTFKTAHATAPPAARTGDPLAGPDPLHQIQLVAAFEPNGCDATGTIQWGRTTSYGQKTEDFTAHLNGDSFAPTISGLTPGTLYHYRAHVSNCDGSADTPDATFVTQPVGVAAVTGQINSQMGTVSGLFGGALGAIRNGLSKLPGFRNITNVTVPMPGVVTVAIGGQIISEHGAGIISGNGSALLAKDQAQIISNDGASLISDNGLGLISNDGGSLIGDNGSGLIGDNGSGLVGNSGGTYRVLSGATAARASAAKKVRKLNVIIAAGQVVTTEAGVVKVELHLSRTGKQLLAAQRKQDKLRAKHHKKPRKLSLKSAIGFAPTAGSGVSIGSSKFSVPAPKTKKAKR